MWQIYPRAVLKMSAPQALAQPRAAAAREVTPVADPGKGAMAAVFAAVVVAAVSVGAALAAVHDARVSRIR